MMYFDIYGNRLRGGDCVRDDNGIKYRVDLSTRDPLFIDGDVGYKISKFEPKIHGDKTELRCVQSD